MALVVVDQSGPVTLERGHRVLDLEKYGEPVASIEYGELYGGYLLHVREFLTADEVAQALALMTELNKKAC